MNTLHHPYFVRNLRLVFCLVVALVARAAGGPVANGTFELNSSTPASILPWAASGSTVGLSVTRILNTGYLSSYSLRVGGRGAATDGPTQNILAGLVNGTRYTTRFRIKLDAPAQVRCLLYFVGTGAPPVILAETVVRTPQTGLWVPVEGTCTPGWTGSPTAARMYFAVEQLYPVGATPPAGAFPGYNLDNVEMETDTDGDGYWDSEEAPGITGTNPLLADTDGDGLPDKWERIHTLNPNDNADAARDDDGDGHANKIEYWANTDPRDAGSYPGITTDPAASPATKALLYYLQTRGARGDGRYLTGQQAHDIANGDYTNYVAGLNTLMTNAGHPSWVSVLGITAEGPSAAQPLQITTSGPVGRAYCDAGGLVVLHFTPRNPWTNNFNGDKTGVDIANLLTPGTTANLRMIGWMDTIAAELALFGPERPVIFRPFSEQNGGWNWYGRLRQDEFNNLYRWMRDYFINTKELHNIIWTIEHHTGAHRPASISSSGAAMDYYYPGDDVIDLVGFSAYTSGWNPGFDADAQSRLHAKAFAITEGGPPPNEDDVANAYNSTYLPALDAWYPRAAFFVIWNSWPTGPFVAIKDNANYVPLLTDPRVTNRESVFWRAPAGLTANPASATQVALSWTPVAGASSYAVETSADGVQGWASAASAATAANGAMVGGLAPGAQRFFRVRALYPNGDSAATDAQVATTFTAAQSWSLAHLGDANAALTGDTDGDGLPELLEYAFATDPLAATNGMPATGLVTDGGVDYLTVRFTRDTATEVTLTVQTSADLVTWDDGSSYGPGGIVPTNDRSTEVSRIAVGGVETITVRSNTPLNAARQFLRVKAGL